jgi:hypothetical protein
MGPSRRLSRPRSTSAPTTGDPCQHVSVPSVRVAVPASHEGCNWFGPGRLIETVFRDPNVAEAPDVCVLAWLAVLGTWADTPRAAAELIEHLFRISPAGLSFWQARTIELLTITAQHTGSRSLDAPCRRHPISTRK